MTSASAPEEMTQADSRDEFHRVVSLQYECVAETLRELLDQKLTACKLSLKQYLLMCQKLLLVGGKTKKFLTTPQKTAFSSNNPSSKNMDISMLTLILLEPCNSKIGITPMEEKYIKKLRDHRNTIAHCSSGCLKDNTLFTETCNDLSDLSKSLNVSYQCSLKTCIAELQQRICIRKHSMQELIEFDREQLFVVLAYKDERDKVHDEKFSETWLKFNLTKWTKQVSRSVGSPSLFLDLCSKCGIPDEIISQIKSERSECEKAPALINYLIKNGTRIQILKFCKQLRKHGPNTRNIADLIEGTNTDGEETNKEIQKYEENRIKEVLLENVTSDEKGYATCEDIHILIEEIIGSDIDFTIVDKIMSRTFECNHEDGRYNGVSVNETYTLSTEDTDSTEDNVNVAGMSLREYAEYVGSQFRSIDERTSLKVAQAIVDETIQMETYVNMEEKDLEEVFSYYLKPEPYTFGIRKQLQRCQADIKKQINSTCMNDECSLRQFDKPFKKEYKQGKVFFSLGGDQHTPAHEFVYPPCLQLKAHFIMKKIVPFIAACINGRKNGTIHFGIKRTGRSTGEIVGITVDNKTLDSVDSIVTSGIKRCFGHLSNNLGRNVVRCTRPAQVISVSEQRKVVVEVDVVPFDKHLGDSFYHVLFPPYGPQEDYFFLYESSSSCDILPISKLREDAIQTELMDAVNERKRLDSEMLTNYRSSYELGQKLIKELCRGAEYITDEFYPIIVAGKIPTSHSDILEYPGLQDAFQNSFAVFDFNNSTSLRRKIEDGNPLFAVRTAEDFIEEEDISFPDDEVPWVYCNGNEDIKNGVMDANTWADERMNPLENFLRCLKKKIPFKRAKVLFLVFEKTNAKDQMVKFARTALLRVFKHQCLIIAEKSDVLESYEDKLSGKTGYEHWLFFGLDWLEISKIFQKVFKETSENVCKIPNSLCTFEEISQKEKEQWKDIELLSMEECVLEEREMTDEEEKCKQKEEETNFYRGKMASWWVFYYGYQRERDLFSKYKTSIETILEGKDGKNVVEVVELRHEPGAGGSTLGRHLIWHFSQSKCTKTPYRCCIVKRITQNTVTEIENFRAFKDEKPRPVIILLDDESDGNMYFRQGLYQLAYKITTPGELFGIIINVSRVSLSKDTIAETESGQIEIKYTLKHRLSKPEKQWFDRKYLELEEKARKQKDIDGISVDVKTLIAFNFMRHSFDRKFIRKTVKEIMADVSDSELNVLKIMALVSAYESGRLVPESVFDSLIDCNPQIQILQTPGDVGKGKPFGMRSRRKAKTNQPPEILNSQPLSLFACRAGYLVSERGLCVISQPLAEEILYCIQENVGIHLEDIVMFVLNHAAIHIEKTNDESLRFVETVCSLFKTREEKGKRRDGLRDRFSRLIVAFIEQENVADPDEGKRRVLRVMNECIRITDDAFVSQQLSRFNIIHMKDFEAAEIAICHAIELCPTNSYLLDTYGQVFKTKMEFIKEKNCQRSRKFDSKVAKDVISLAFKAIDKFIEGQHTTQEYEKDRLNLNCYHMEVETLVGLLEIFESFECYTNEEELVCILRRNNTDVGSSFLAGLNNNNCIEQLIVGGKIQAHAAESLRFVEERDYQVKQIYTIYTEEDVLLLNLRERYEKYYSSHGLRYQLKFGYGLKPLMRAYNSGKDRQLVEERFLEAASNLENLPLEVADTKDLLFFLGYSFMQLLNNEIRIDTNLNRHLLSYSAKLLDTQTQSDIQRPYLEAFLFYCIFHWPTSNRFRFPNLSAPSTYTQVMEDWDETFLKNNYMKSRDQTKANRGKTYFALSKDSLGVIDLDEIEMIWRQKKETEEGRSRMQVYKDYFWREPFVADQLQRLSGILDGYGTVIAHEVEYPKGKYVFHIKAIYPCVHLRNRDVTFVLAFTWSGVRAYDVIEKSDEIQNEKRQSIKEETHSQRTQHKMKRDDSVYPYKGSPKNNTSKPSLHTAIRKVAPVQAVKAKHKISYAAAASEKVNTTKGEANQRDMCGHLKQSSTPENQFDGKGYVPVSQWGFPEDDMAYQYALTTPQHSLQQQFYESTPEGTYNSSTRPVSGHLKQSSTPENQFDGKGYAPVSQWGFPEDNMAYQYELTTPQHSLEQQFYASTPEGTYNSSTRPVSGHLKQSSTPENQFDGKGYVPVSQWEFPEDNMAYQYELTTPQHSLQQQFYASTPEGTYNSSTRPVSGHLKQSSTPENQFDGKGYVPVSQWEFPEDNMAYQYKLTTPQHSLQQQFYASTPEGTYNSSTRPVSGHLKQSSTPENQFDGKGYVPVSQWEFPEDNMAYQYELTTPQHSLQQQFYASTPEGTYNSSTRPVSGHLKQSSTPENQFDGKGYVPVSQWEFPEDNMAYQYELTTPQHSLQQQFYASTHEGTYNSSTRPVSGHLKQSSTPENQFDGKGYVPVSQWEFPEDNMAYQYALTTPQHSLQQQFYASTPEGTYNSSTRPVSGHSNTTQTSGHQFYAPDNTHVPVWAKSQGPSENFRSGDTYNPTETTHAWMQTSSYHDNQYAFAPQHQYNQHFNAHTPPERIYTRSIPLIPDQPAYQPQLYDRSPMPVWGDFTYSGVSNNVGENTSPPMMHVNDQFQTTKQSAYSHNPSAKFNEDIPDIYNTPEKDYFPHTLDTPEHAAAQTRDTRKWETATRKKKRNKSEAKNEPTKNKMDSLDEID